MKRIPAFAGRLRSRARAPVERDYAYFQEFIADNHQDTRVIVVGNRAWASIRICRPGDFRASGSGKLVPIVRSEAGMAPIRIAFETSRRLGCQSMAYDFLTDGETGRCLISEISCFFQASISELAQTPASKSPMTENREAMMVLIDIRFMPHMT